MTLLLEFFANPKNEWIWHPVQATLVVVGFYLVSRQLRLARDQNSISHLNYFREVWNSEPLLRARLAVSEKTGQDSSDFKGYEDVIAAFMEDLGVAISVGQVNTEHLWSYYSFYIDGYWMLLKPKVNFYRERTSDSSYFEEFEKLSQLSEKVAHRHGTFPMPEAYLLSFRKEESRAVRFLLSSNLPNDRFQ